MCNLPIINLVCFQSGEKVLVLKKKFRDVTNAPSKNRSEFKEPLPGGGRPKKARQEKPTIESGT